MNLFIAIVVLCGTLCCVGGDSSHGGSSGSYGSYYKRGGNFRAYKPGRFRTYGGGNLRSYGNNVLGVYGPSFGGYDGYYKQNNFGSYGSIGRAVNAGGYIPGASYGLGSTGIYGGHSLNGIYGYGSNFGQNRLGYPTCGSGRNLCCQLRQKCYSNKDCCTGNCQYGVCVKPCSSNGYKCYSSNDCCSRNCYYGVCSLRVRQRSQQRQCSSNGFKCYNNFDCCSRSCVYGVCGLVRSRQYGRRGGCLPIGRQCSSRSQCCSGYSRAGRCCARY